MDKLNKFLEKFQRRDYKLSPVERYSTRLGYLSTAFIMMSPHLLEYGNTGYITYVIGGFLGLPQVMVAKQINLILLNLNVIIAYGLLIK